MVSEGERSDICPPGASRVAGQRVGGGTDHEDK